MQVRDSVSGVRLFDYDPNDETITIVKKKVRYRIKPFKDYDGVKYKVISSTPIKCNKV